jgi:hypothetical protein
VIKEVVTKTGEGRAIVTKPVARIPLWQRRCGGLAWYRDGRVGGSYAADGRVALADRYIPIRAKLPNAGISFR